MAKIDITHEPSHLVQFRGVLEGAVRSTESMETKAKPVLPPIGAKIDSHLSKKRKERQIAVNVRETI